MHLDRVYVKLVNWVEWGKAGNKLIQNIDFLQHEKLNEYIEAKMQDNEGQKVERIEYNLGVVEEVPVVEEENDEEKEDS